MGMLILTAHALRPCSPQKALLGVGHALLAWLLLLPFVATALSLAFRPGFANLARRCVHLHAHTCVACCRSDAVTSKRGPATQSGQQDRRRHGADVTAAPYGEAAGRRRPDTACAEGELGAGARARRCRGTIVMTKPLRLSFVFNCSCLLVELSENLFVVLLCWTFLL